MRAIFTAVTFLLVLVAPSILAMRASDMKFERPKKKAKRGDPITLFRDTTD